MRRFPLAKTFRNLRFNLKNYQPATLRPSFQSTNHPFCTNSQLLEASYSQWFKDVSKQIPSKIITQLTENLDRQYEQNQAAAEKWVALPASSMAFNVPTDYQNWEETLENYNNSKKSAYPNPLEIVHLNNLQQIASSLKLHAEKGQYIETSLLVEILKSHLSVEDSSQDGHPEHALCELDPQLQCFTPFYSHLRARIPALYDICYLYESRLFANKHFQEVFVRACYHKNDVDMLQQLLFAYLKHSTYDSTTLNYIFTSLVRNYEVEFFKGLISNLMALGRTLDPIILEVAVSQLVSVLALFENIVHVFQAWLKSTHGSPTPKTLAILVHEYAKYGDQDEIDTLSQIIKQYGYEENSHIQLAQLQSHIIMREPSHFKKTITNEDLAAAESILQSVKLINNEKDIKHFFHLMVLFLSKFTNLEMVERFIFKLKGDFIHDETIHRVISKYFVRHDQFVPLIRYLQKSDVRFDVAYLKDIFDCFVKTYPYQAREFSDQFHHFLRLSDSMPQPALDAILPSFQISTLDSQLTPYCIERQEFDSRKYDSPSWKRIEWKTTNGGKHKSASIQVDFRISRGFRDVMRKGVKPDYKVIETTFRRLNPLNRAKILEFLRAMRFPVKDCEKLAILNLQLSKDKNLLKAYLQSQPVEELNCNNIIMLGRMLLNKSMYRPNTKLLNSVRTMEMNDRTRMVLLNLQLRNALKQGNYTGIVETIESFPIDEVVLSPYLYKQGHYIEKDLEKRLSRTPDASDDGQQALAAVRGLLGDISIRLDRDKEDVAVQVHEMFLWLKKWMKEDIRRV